MEVWTPRYASPGNPGGIIPPSPVAETRAKHRRLVAKELRTHAGRVLCPGERGYEETVYAIGTGIFFPGLARIRNENGGAAAVAAPTGLRWSYSFDSTSWLDNTASANNLTSFGSPTNPAGKLSNCISWTGGPDGAYHAYNSAFNLGTGSASYTAWANLGSKSGSSRIISMAGTTAEDYYMLYIQSFDVFQCGGTDSGGTGHFLRASTFGAASLSTWYFIAVIWDAASNLLKISVNNGTQDTTSATGGIHAPNTDSRLVFGAQWNGSIFQNGAASYKVDEVNGWNVALSSTQLTTLYNSGTGLAYPYTGV